MQPKLGGVAVSFEQTTPTRLQHKAFDLLGVSLILQSCIGLGSSPIARLPEGLHGTYPARGVSWV